MTEVVSRVWTEFRPRFGLVVASVLSAGVLVGLETGPSRVVLVVVVAAAVLAALSSDGYVGVLIGLAGAALLITVKRITGDLSPQDFFMVAAEVVTVLTVSWLVGILGHHLRSSVQRATRPAAGSVMPTHNLMGVLGADIGLHRLEEELGRRQASGGPLALVLVSQRPAGSTDVPEPARRAVARHVESVLGATDVLFAVDEETLAVIAPTADWTSGLRTLNDVALAASLATYTDPVDRSRRVVGDTTSIDCSLVFADDATADAPSLVAAAQRGAGAGAGPGAA